MICKLIRNQRGQVFPLVLIILVAGVAVVLPSLDYVSTSLKTGEVIEENVEALYAADAGVEDAIWRLKHPPWPDFPYLYTLQTASHETVFNGMTVDVTIDYVPSLGGEDTPKIGVHEDWLHIEKSLSYDGSFYNYTLILTSWYTPSVIRIEQIVIFDIPAALEYQWGTSTGITIEDPDITGGEYASQTLTWNLQPSYVLQPPDPHAGPEQATLTFKLKAPAGSYGVGFTSVTATRQDIGTITDFYPFTITATARNAKGVEQATIKAGIWVYGIAYICDWDITP